MHLLPPYLVPVPHLKMKGHLLWSSVSLSLPLCVPVGDGSKGQNWFVWVAFQNAEVLMVPSSLLAIWTSKKASLPSDSSTVNCTHSSMLWNDHERPQSGLGGFPYVCHQCNASMSSITRFMTTTGTGYPIAVPFTRWYTFSLNDKRVAFEHIDNKFMMSSTWLPLLGKLPSPKWPPPWPSPYPEHSTLFLAIIQLIIHSPNCK